MIRILFNSILFKKLPRYFLVFFCVLVCAGVLAFTYILYFDYDFNVPKPIKRYIEHKISRSTGTESTAISQIRITKSGRDQINISVIKLSSVSGEVNIISSPLLKISINTSALLKRIGLSIYSTKLSLNIRRLKIGSNNNAKKITTGTLKALNDVIQDKLSLGYVYTEKINIEQFNVYNNNRFYLYKIKYDLIEQEHNFILSFAEKKKADLQIKASSANNINYIYGEIINFPGWFLTLMLPDDLHTDLTKKITDELSLNGKLNYSFPKNKSPTIKLNLESNMVGKDDDIKKISVLASNHNSFNELHLDKLVLDIKGNGSVKAKGNITSDSNFFGDTVKIYMDVSLEKISTNLIGHFWPEQIQKETRKWITERFSNGRINLASCKINISDIKKITKNDLSAYVDFNTLDIKYYDEHKSITKLDGTANFDMESVKINVNKGKLLSSNIDKAFIEIEYGTKDVPITIKTKAHGDVRDFVHLAGKKYYTKLSNKGLDLNAIDGSLKTAVYIRFPIALGFDFDKSKIAVKADIDKLQTLLYNKIFLSNGELRFEINNKFLSISGPININDQSSSFEWLSQFQSSKTEPTTKFTIHSYIKDNSNFEEILNNKLRILEGNALLNLVYFEKNNNEKIQVSMDFDDAHFYIPSFGINKPKKQTSTLNIDLEKKPDQNWISKTLSLKSEELININGNLSAKKDFSAIEDISLNIQYPDSDFKVNYSENQNSKSFQIHGDTINLSNAHISEIFSNNSFTSHNHENKNAKNKHFLAKIDLGKVLVNNGVVFSNIYGEFDCLELNCSKSNLEAKFDKNSEIRIWREYDQKNNVEWLLHTNNASRLLQGLGLYEDLEGGELTLKMWNVNQSKVLVNPKSVYLGTIKMKNFQAIKNPLVTKLVSFTSIFGILNIFTNMNKIPFDNLDGHFVLADDVLRLNRINATGHYLTLTMNGTLDWNYDDVNLYGKIVPPVYGLNYVLAAIPFIGHKTADGKGKGLIAANYSITGKIGHTSVFMNPLAIFMPEIIEYALFL